MKYFIFILLLIGCSKPMHTQFVAGQAVTVRYGFYKGCSGAVAGLRGFNNQEVEIANTWCQGLHVHEITVPIEFLYPKFGE